MDTKFIILAICLIMQVLAQEEEASKERQEVGIIGGSITLTCSLPTSDPPQIAWSDKIFNKRRGAAVIFNSTQGMGIDQTHLNKDNMAIDGEYKLTINSLFSGFEEEGNEYGVSSSGLYFCQSYVDGEWQSETIHLSVVSKPTCEGDVELRESESTQLKCSVVYSGKTPTLQWYRNGKKVNSEVVSDIGEFYNELTIDEAIYSDDQSIYTCRMTMGEVTEECQKTLSVQYPVREMKLIPENEDVVYLGQEIKCSVRGNPQPKIQFSPEATDGVYSGRNFKAMPVDSSWLNKMTTVTCTAENTFDGKVEIIEKSITFNVTEAKADDVSGDASQNSVSVLALTTAFFGLVMAALL